MQEARLVCGRIRDGAHDEGKRILELDHTWAWAGRAPFGACLAQPSLIPCFPSFSPSTKTLLLPGVCEAIMVYIARTQVPSAVLASVSRQKETSVTLASTICRVDKWGLA
jgi:hypothetical protein